MFDNLAEDVNRNDALVRRGRYVNATMLVEVGSDGYLIRIAEGRVVDVAASPRLMPNWTFALRAPAEAWEKFWQAKPPPGFTDLFALVRKRLLRIEGDLHPFMANLLYFKEVLAAPRRREGN
jgi:hypothetical protein